MGDEEKKKQREAVKEAVSTAGPVYINSVLLELKEKGISETEAKAAARHLVQTGSLAFDDQMKLVERKRDRSD